MPVLLRALSCSIALALAGSDTLWAATSPETIAASVADAMDTRVDPCEDFYAYACGGWISAHQADLASQSMVTRAFDMAQADIQNKLKLIFEGAVTASVTDTDRYRVGQLYNACLNGQSDVAALQTTRDEINGIQNVNDFLRMAGKLTRMGAPTLLAPSVAPDIRPSHTGFIVFADAGDPGYPDGDLYLRNDKFNQARRQVLKDYVVQVLGQFSIHAMHADAILAIDKVVAKFDSTYGQAGKLIVIPASVLSYAPFAANWKSYADGLGTADDWTLVVDRSYLQSITNTVIRYSLDTLKAYLHWRLATAYQHYLPLAFRTNTPISGIPRASATPEESCVDETSYLLGDVAGKLLIQDDATAQKVQPATAMLSGVEAVLGAERLDLPWMKSDKSRDAVETKLNALVSFVGYPQTWSTMAAADSQKTDLLGKAIALKTAEMDRSFARMDQTIDRSQWNSDMSVQTVNAFNELSVNQIYMLAGLMRAPFFDADYPLAMNYGGLGYVLGHELVHGFASYGRNYGPDGKYGPWLQMPDNTRFNARAQCFVSQYGKYSGAPGTKVNGKKTLEENLADNGGLHLAYGALKAALAATQANQPSINGLTPEQLFFVSFAQLNCEVATPDAAYYRYSRSWRRYPPSKFRALGPIVNSRNFADAFQCPVQAPMNPVRKCTVW